MSVPAAGCIGPSGAVSETGAGAGRREVRGAREGGASDAMKLVNEAEVWLHNGHLDAALAMAQRAQASLQEAADVEAEAEDEESEDEEGDAMSHGGSSQEEGGGEVVEAEPARYPALTRRADQRGLWPPSDHHN